MPLYNYVILCQVAVLSEEIGLNINVLVGLWSLGNKPFTIMLPIGFLFVYLLGSSVHGMFLFA